MRLNVPGRWRPRPGWQNFSTTSLGAERAQGGKRVYLHGVAPFTLVAWQGDIYKPSDTGVWGSPVLTGFDPTNLIDFPSDSHMVAVFDGVTAPHSTDGGRSRSASPRPCGAVPEQYVGRHAPRPRL